MIVTDTDILRKKSKIVTLKEGQKAIDDLQKFFCKEVGDKGVGLSAIQIGEPKRVICINFQGQIRNIINPELIKVSSQKSSRSEGCLSIPSTIKNEISIVRPKRIKLKYTNYGGDTILEKFDGIIARAILHELDHLDGVLISDYA